MINNTKPLSMVEVQAYIKKSEDSEADIMEFIKKFVKLNLKDAKKLMNKIEELDLIKIKKEHIVKIIDLMPKTQEELNKIFVDVSLNEDETNKILDTIKEFN